MRVRDVVIVVACDQDAAGAADPEERLARLRHISSRPGLMLALTRAMARSPPRHADPRTTMWYDRARQNLDRDPNYILAAHMASGT